MMILRLHHGMRILLQACLLAFLFAGVSVAFAGSKAGNDSAGVFVSNEELTYEVSYMSIPLGSVRTVITRVQGEGKTATIMAAAYIRSYSGVPFVHIQETDETTMNHEGIPFAFQSREQVDEKWKITDYAFDQQAHRLVAKESMADSDTKTGGTLKKIDTVSIGKNCVDGLSLLYFARLNALNPEPAAVPTFIKGKEGTTQINFQHKITSEDIDAVDYPVDVVEVDGDAQISGILGMSGDFTGWFSNDSARVPIKGKVKIFLGSITIELKKWTRPGWNPPRSSKR